MKILIAGASGLIGKELVPFLKANGHEVSTLTRQEKGQGIFWDPENNILPHEKLENFDVVINLAGESIAGSLWTVKKKQKIKDSRIKSTTLLANTLSKLQYPPKVFINASAIGYYGTMAEGNNDEVVKNGTGFLAEVCEEWEKATLPAKLAGIRTVLLRFGIVLSAKGGALATMLFPFKWGLGGKIGSGKQWMSWIAIDDVVGGIHHVIINQEIEGPINFTAPHPVQNKDFTCSLSSVLHRPALFPLPAFIARFILGDMADELLLSSVKAIPVKLEKSNYMFKYPHLRAALTHLLGKDHE